MANVCVACKCHADLFKWLDPVTMSEFIKIETNSCHARLWQITGLDELQKMLKYNWIAVNSRWVVLRLVKSTSEHLLKNFTRFRQQTFVHFVSLASNDECEVGKHGVL